MDLEAGHGESTAVTRQTNKRVKKKMNNKNNKKMNNKKNKG